MILDKSNVVFGRHESFALRYGWLTKGFNAFQNSGDFFKSDSAPVELGVGRNMVNAIRYWLLAAQITADAGKSISKIGCAIFDKETGFDPFLEDEATIWLIHWLLASNPNKATAIYWFFNKFHKAEFSSEEVQTALNDFVKDQLDAKTSASTIKNDALLILRMYTTSKIGKKALADEALDSPLSLLRLVTQGSTAKNYLSKPEERPQLPLGVFGFAVAQLMKSREMASLPIEELMYAKDDYVAPGAIFRLSENDLITKLEQLVHYIPNIFEIRDTAGIHQLFLVREKFDELRFLKKHYQAVCGGLAA